MPRADERSSVDQTSSSAFRPVSHWAERRLGCRVHLAWEVSSEGWYTDVDTGKAEEESTFYPCREPTTVIGWPDLRSAFQQPTPSSGRSYTLWKGE